MPAPVSQTSAVLALGKAGNRQLAGKPVQITKARGTFTTRDITGDRPVLPLLGPFHVLRRPELRDIYDSDFRQLGVLRDCNWSVAEFGRSSTTEGYRWTKDLQFLLDDPPSAVSLDCETVGLDWHLPGFRILNVSLTTRKGVSYVVPLDVDYARDESLHGVQTPEWMKKLTVRDVARSKAQLKELLSNPGVSVVGHNCVDGESELLTPSGWRRFDSLEGCSTTAMQFNLSTQNLSFREAMISRRSFDGELFVWDTEFHQGAYTADHRMVIKGEQGLNPFNLWRMQPACEVEQFSMNATVVPSGGKYEANGWDVPDTWVPIIEAARADAEVVGGIRFNLKKRRKIERIQRLLQRAGVPFSIHSNGDAVRIRILDSECARFIRRLFADGKRLGAWILELSLSQRIAWLEEARFWDGCSEHAGSTWSFSTADRQTAEWFQTMAHISGYRYALRRRDNKKGYNAKNPDAVLWNACVRKTNKCKLVDKPVRAPHKGVVYCLRIPSGAFLIRRKGVVWVTGSC